MKQLVNIRYYIVNGILHWECQVCGKGDQAKWDSLAMIKLLNISRQHMH